MGWLLLKKLKLQKRKEVCQRKINWPELIIAIGFLIAILLILFDLLKFASHLEEKHRTVNGKQRIHQSFMTFNHIIQMSIYGEQLH